MTRIPITIELTKDEAIVVFDLIGRINSQENPSIFQHQAEQRVFWNIECALEKILGEPLKGNYQDVLQKAREKISDKV